MMRDREMFGKEVCFVVCTCSPLNLELLLAFTVLEPVVLRVDGFGPALFDGLVGNTDSGGVVTSYWCWWLGAPHFFERVAIWNCIDTIVETTRRFSFGNGGYNRFDDAGLFFFMAPLLSSMPRVPSQ